MPSIQSILLCGLIKPRNKKTKQTTESSSNDDTPSPPPPPSLGPRPSRKLRRNAWVYFRRPSQSSARSNRSPSSTSVNTTTSTAPGQPLRRAAPLTDLSLSLPTGDWSAYKAAQEVAMRSHEERERRRAREQERRDAESEERGKEFRARRRIEGQRESREVEEWFRGMMSKW